jgi:hypothetical protein
MAVSHEVKNKKSQNFDSSLINWSGSIKEKSKKSDESIPSV